MEKKVKAKLSLRLRIAKMLVDHAGGGVWSSFAVRELSARFIREIHTHAHIVHNQ